MILSYSISQIVKTERLNILRIYGLLYKNLLASNEEKLPL